MNKRGPKPKKYPKLKLPTYFKGTLFAQLKTSDRVEVVGFGTFQIVKIPSRKMFHNFSGKERIIKGYTKLKFTQSPLLKYALSYKKIGKYAGADVYVDK